MEIRTSTEGDEGAILGCLARPSINTTTPERFTKLLASGSYRPEWTWIAEDGDRILGLAVWWGPPGGDRPQSLDCLYADPSVEDPVPLWTDLINEAGAGAGEYHIFVGPGWRDDAELRAAVDPRLAAAARAGMTGLVERLRYEWLPAAGVPARSTRLTLTEEPDDESFIDVFRRVAEGSLDAHTRAEVARQGAAGYARAELDGYRQMPGPREWWRLARNADGELVGFALPSANTAGPVVGFLGVLPEHRGRGYVDDLLAEITAFLAGTGAERIVADTDTTNLPMAAAFDRAGYRVFGIRLVASRAA